MSFDPRQIRSLCLLRLSAIGDVCHAVAMVQAIQRQYPALAITWVIGKVEYQLLKHLPGIEFVVFDKSQGWRSYRVLKHAFHGRRFDVLLHMQVALRATIASLMIPAKVRIGFDRARAKEGQWLVTNEHVAPLATPHVLDGFMGFAAKLGVTDLAPRWQIPVPVVATEFAQQQMGTQRWLVICPAASKAERNWLPERYAALAEHAAAKGFNIMLCGGPAAMEQQLAVDIINACQCKISNLVGKTSLVQMLAILRQASLVVAPDTGPTHMAVTQGTPVIGLYAHSNPGRTGPYLWRQYVVSVYDQVIAEQHPDKPVRWGTRAKGEHLMERISVAAVQEVFDQVIAEQHL
ncbi:glycosyltransferase family 9 protein [Shewanella yunxiaonensis]|uniref:Glycosyltransferase family 9 protein n=1 Tax=Shewanella yunxiaonensis TaxID=2829809 RepID=A0ABX7YU45_9GAMM|nr:MULTISPECIES: glycosyltransferase family 9 protein [Shewanella]MDF0533495.1 glycosyltransferase family 9 protein [Shewanella sp. A32]QUN05866.1 glycosyltransferase family 9 protein [Shewanella yunxiaonensis]